MNDYDDELTLKGNIPYILLLLLLLLAITCVAFLGYVGPTYESPNKICEEHGYHGATQIGQDDWCYVVIKGHVLYEQVKE